LLTAKPFYSSGKPLPFSPFFLSEILQNPLKTAACVLGKKIAVHCYTALMNFRYNNDFSF